MTLHPGDLAVIVAPAAQLPQGDQPLLASAIALLGSWGLRVALRIAPDHHFYLAGHDAQRAAHLASALADPEVRAIFCARGGYGSARLLPLLSDEPVTTPKLLVGCSDITALHLGLSRLAPGVRRVHGPELVTRKLLGPLPGDDQQPSCEAAAAVALNQASLHAALFDPEKPIEEPVEVLRAGLAEGPLEGGCLSLVCSLMGTPYALRPEGKVLFLEDVAEPPYKVDRMLTQMRLAGLFDGVKGLVFGTMHRCTDPYNDLRDVILDALADLDLPIAFGLRSGHGDINLSLPLGAPARLDLGAGRGTIRIG